MVWNRKRLKFKNIYSFYVKVYIKGGTCGHFEGTRKYNPSSNYVYYYFMLFLSLTEKKVKSNSTIIYSTYNICIILIN